MNCRFIPLICVCLLLQSCAADGFDYKGPAISLNFGYKGVGFGVTLFDKEPTAPLVVTVDQKQEEPKPVTVASK